VDKVNLGLIGAGGMANRVHYPSLAEFDDVTMAALCDLVEDKLNATADKFGIGKRYSDYREMVEKESLDAVYVLMPPHHLFDIVVHCLKQGLHVFIEKPPAVTRFQIESLARHARENDCLTMVAFNRRFVPMLTEAKKMVEAQGAITSCVATFYKDGKAGAYYAGAVDILSCDAVHAVDALRWMAGSEPKAVASCVATYDDVAPNCFNSVVRFENGVCGVLLAHWATGGRVHTFEMHTRGASAFLNPNAEGTVTIGKETKVLKTEEVAGSDENHKFYGFFGENRHFIDCIKAGEQPMTNFDDAAKTMKLVEDIYSNSI